MNTLNASVNRRPFAAVPITVCYKKKHAHDLESANMYFIICIGICLCLGICVFILVCDLLVLMYGAHHTNVVFQLPTDC